MNFLVSVSDRTSPNPRELQTRFPFLGPDRICELLASELTWPSHRLIDVGHHLLSPTSPRALNIPANVSELAEGAGSTGGKLPAGALQTRTDFGVPGYGGPCPPEGDHPHRYLFTVFAVKTDNLDVKPDTSAAVVGFNLHFNTFAKAEIMGLFKR